MKAKRVFRHGELHLVVLALLAQRPMHGYELMNELASRLGGMYTPSPGSIYPAVQALEAEGLLASAEQGERRVFSVTPTGREAVERRSDALAKFEVRTGARIRSDDALDGALERFSARVRAVAPAVDPEVLDSALDRAAGDIEALGRGVAGA